MNHSENDLYNVGQYTDDELYELLDLNHPTDRELEAKIIFFIKKYEDAYITAKGRNPNSITTKNAQRMIQFFEEIYAHFFEIDLDEIEGFDTMNSVSNNIANALGSQTDICYNDVSTTLVPTPGTSGPLTTPGTSTTTQGDQISNQLATQTGTISDQQIGYTRSFDYSKSYTNPLLKETITRIISIDSQFRDQSTHSYSTDFTFNLSDTLQDVVSLKLYSIQLPYTWWTINKNFGSNYFYIKGVSTGIVGSEHDYQLAIASGTYPTPNDIIIALQASIATMKSIHTDVSFGTTNITIGTQSTSNPSSLASLTIDITNLYNETFFYLDWGQSWSSPLDPNNRVNTIPGLLGFNYPGNNEEYTPNTIYSNTIMAATLYPNNSYPNIANTYTIPVDGSNNFFTIYFYDGTTNLYYNLSIPPLLTVIVNLGLPDGQYTPNQLFTAINTALQQNNTTFIPASSRNLTYPNIIESSLSSLSVTEDPNVPGNYRYKLTIQMSRLANPLSSVSNIKTAVVFPIGTPGQNRLWTPPQSTFKGCFFFNEYNELNTIVSETSSVVTSYTITTTPYILFTCTKPYFDNSVNNIIVTVPNSPLGSPYSLAQLIGAINTSFANTPYITASSLIQNNDSLAEFDINISKHFNESGYTLNLSNSILTTFGFNTIYTNLPPVITSTPIPYQTSWVVDNTNNTFFLYQNGSTPGNTMSPGYKIQLIPSGNIGYTYSQLQSAINTAFSSGTFINDMSGNPSTDLTHSSISINTIRYPIQIQSQLDIIIHNTLNTDNYIATFVDTSTNIWATDFYLEHSSYNLASTYNYSTNISTIKGTDAIRSNLITLTSANNHFYIRSRPNVNGIYVGGSQSTDIPITIPLQPNTTSNAYTKEQLVSAINGIFASNPVTNGTQIFTDANLNVNIRMNVNKVYTAKDYNVVFYDIYSFVYCNVGVTGTSSKRNITQDATLGWILGFRTNTIYHLSNPTTIDAVYPNNIPLSGTIYNNNGTGTIATLQGDTTVNTNLYNYFLLILNDYTQNHLNDGLVTLITKDTSIPLPSYAERSTYVCDPITGKLSLPSSITNTNAVGNALTQKQVYSANAILQNQQNTSMNLFSNGPFIQDVFAVIPIKTSGYSIGQTYVEFGGTLQQQERSYFGPVNIRRMSVQLITDRGDVLDLNGANWSFGLVCQQLYHPPQS